MSGNGEDRFVGSGFFVTFKYFQGIPYFKEEQEYLKVLVTAANNVVKINS